MSWQTRLYGSEGLHRNYAKGIWRELACGSGPSVTLFHPKSDIRVIIETTVHPLEVSHHRLPYFLSSIPRYILRTVPILNRPLFVRISLAVPSINTCTHTEYFTHTTLCCFIKSAVAYLPPWTTCSPLPLVRTKYQATVLVYIEKGSAGIPARRGPA